MTKKNITYIIIALVIVVFIVYLIMSKSPAGTESEPEQEQEQEQFTQEDMQGQNTADESVEQETETAISESAGIDELNQELDKLDLEGSDVEF